MFPWAAPKEPPAESVRNNCPAVWGNGLDDGDNSITMDEIEARFRNKQVIVLSRFHEKERRTYRNLAMKSKRVVEVLTGEYLGISHDMSIEKEKNTPSWIAVGACRFRDGKKGYEWMDSDPNFMGNDLLSHTHEAWLIKLDEAEATKDGNNIWFLNNVFCKREDVPAAIEKLNGLKRGIQKFSGRVVANNNLGLRIKGNSTAPEYIILIQFRSFQYYRDWMKSQEGFEFLDVVNPLGDRESLLFALCPDFPSPAEWKSNDDLADYIKMHGQD